MKNSYHLIITLLRTQICTEMRGKGLNGTRKDKGGGSLRYDIKDVFGTVMSYYPYNCTLGCCVLLLNVLVLYFYLKQYRQFVPCMYLINALFDSLMVVFDIAAGATISTFMERSDLYFLERRWRLLFLVILTRCSIRMSIFVNTLLSVARTIKTVSPFFRIKMRYALLSIVIYTFYWITLATLDVLAMNVKTETDARKTARYGKFIEQSQIGQTALSQLIRNKLARKAVPFVSGFLVPFVVPAVVCLISATIMILHLRKETPSQRSVAVQRHVSKTVLLITVCFVTLHTISTVYTIVAKIDTGLNEVVAANRYVFWSTLPLINSLLNPAILMSRSTELRGKLGTLFRRAKVGNYEREMKQL